MDVMQRRRALLMMQHGPKELYPVGTDILGMYLGKTSDGRVIVQGDYTIDDSTGELKPQSGRSASEIYIPVSTDYTYAKGPKRIGIYYYDKNKIYLGYTVNTWQPQEQIVPAFKEGTAFIRCVFLAGTNLIVDLIRTA